MNGAFLRSPRLERHPGVTPLAGKSTSPLCGNEDLLPLTPAEHDRLHWLAGEVIAGRLTLAEAERLAVRL